MSEPSSRPRAQQSRSRDTEQRILATAVRVLGEQGAEGLTTANVSVAAGVSVGSLYRRFGNKEHLLRAAQGEFLRVFEGTITGRLLALSDADAADPAATITHVTTGLAESFAESAAPLRALLLVGLQNPVVYADGHAASVRGGNVFAELVLRHRAAITQPDPEAAVDFAYRLIYATCSHRIIQGEGLESDRPLGWTEMTAQLARANCAYLLAPSSV